MNEVKVLDVAEIVEANMEGGSGVLPKGFTSKKLDGATTH